MLPVCSPTQSTSWIQGRGLVLLGSNSTPFVHKTIKTKMCEEVWQHMNLHVGSYCTSGAVSLRSCFNLAHFLYTAHKREHNPRRETRRRQTSKYPDRRQWCSVLTVMLLALRMHADSTEDLQYSTASWCHWSCSVHPLPRWVLAAIVLVRVT